MKETLSPSVNIDSSNWPDWLQTVPTQYQSLGALLLLVLLAFVFSVLIKRAVRIFGRRRYESEDDFLGSSWDLAAPLIQILVFLAAFTGGAKLLGFSFGTGLVDLWPKALSGLVIIIAAIVLANWINRSLRAYGKRAHARQKIDDTLIAFISSIIRYVILGIAILAAMTEFGFAPGSLIAIVGAAGLAVALALQDTLKAVAAGFMMAAFRPFRIGDWVEIAGLSGEIVEVMPFTTVIRQVDNKTVFLTNDKVWGEAIINYTRESRRRFDLYFDVHYRTDLKFALEVLKDEANKHPGIETRSETWVGVHELKDWSILLRLRAWVPSKDFVTVRSDLLQSIKQRFEAENIEIPYPHQIEIQGER